MKNNQRVFIAAVWLSLLVGGSAFAATSQRDRIPIHDDPNSALCRGVVRATTELRGEWESLTSRFYHDGERKELSAHDVTFPTWRTKSFVFSNVAGELRTLEIGYYLIDIDNTGAAEMINFVTGGHLATGDGTTLMILSKDFSEATEPVPDDLLRHSALEIGPLDVRFTGREFDVGYYLYPFVFEGKRYLLVEGNGDEYGKSLVAELVPGTGLVTHCYFGEGTLRTYSSVRTGVSVAEGPQPDTYRRRPEGYFQLAGAVDARLCGEVLEAFNEPGRYEGDDGTRWLLDNSHQIDFASLDPKAPPGTQYVFPDLEYVRVDIDRDGTDEHVYRLNSVLSSQWIQRLMIVPDELQQQPKLLAPYSEQCEKVDPRAECAAPITAIRYALMARVPEKLANEWQFTRSGPWGWVTHDDASRELIYAGRNQLKRNIGDDSSANWSLYKVASAVVAVGAPLFFDFAPPELLVFVPSKRQEGNLRCILMPKVWHEPRERVEEEP